MDSRAKLEEERLNRPRPPPGGGITESSNPNPTRGEDITGESKDVQGGGIGNVIENGQKLSALVLHLRATRKSSKKNSKGSQTTATTVTGGVSSSVSTKELKVKSSGTATKVKSGSGKQQQNQAPDKDKNKGTLRKKVERDGSSNASTSGGVQPSDRSCKNPNTSLMVNEAESTAVKNKKNRERNIKRRSKKNENVRTPAAILTRSNPTA